MPAATVEIRSLEDFTGRIANLEETDVWRGHGSTSYKLLPSVARPGFTSDSYLHQFERAILNDFKRKAHPYLDAEPQNDFEWLFLAHVVLPGW
jgi:hypothetical protein